MANERENMTRPQADWVQKGLATAHLQQVVNPAPVAQTPTPAPASPVPAAPAKE